MKVRLEDLTYCNKRVVYIIENLVDSWVYIGSTPRGSAKKRFKQHQYMLNKNKHPNSRLQKAFNLYGAKSFIFKIDKWFSDEVEELDILTGEDDLLSATENKYNRFKSSLYPNKCIKGIPKTKTDSWFKGREAFKNTVRGRSKKVYVFNYKGEFVKSFRSVSDIVDYTKSDHDLPVIVQSNTPRKSKNGSVPIYRLEVNNMLKVLRGKQRSHKGLIFSYESEINYTLQPSDIKCRYTTWEQCYFYNNKLL